MKFKKISFHTFLWYSLIWLICLLPVVGAFTTSRPFYPYNVFFGFGGVSRYIVFIILGIGILGIVTSLPGLRKQSKKGFLIWATSQLFFMSYLLSCKFGVVPKFNLNSVIFPTIFTFAYLSTPNFDFFIKQSKKIILFYAYASLIGMLVLPSFVLETNYIQGWIPGFNIRLHGVVNHANNLAPFLLMYLMIEIVHPTESKFSKMNKAVVLLGILLAQSKTIWLILALVYFLRVFYRIFNIKNRNLYLKVSTLFFSVALIIISFFSFDVLGKINGFASDKNINDLTGRTDIWSQTVQLWKLNPIFGYGSTLWDERMAYSYGLTHNGWAPAHAHSQFYQTLGESGVIGVISLVLYLLVLLCFGFKYFKMSNFMSLGFIVLFIIRGFTEPIFRVVFDNNFVIHFFVFMIFLMFAKNKIQINSQLEKKTT